jgi:hypothetical protein
MRTCGTHPRDEIYLQNLVRKPEGKRPVGRPRCRWEDNIKMGVGDIM